MDAGARVAVGDEALVDDRLVDHAAGTLPDTRSVSQSLAFSLSRSLHLSLSLSLSRSLSRSLSLSLSLSIALSLSHCLTVPAVEVDAGAGIAVGDAPSRKGSSTLPGVYKDVIV